MIARAVQQLAIPLWGDSNSFDFVCLASIYERLISVVTFVVAVHPYFSGGVRKLVCFKTFTRTL